MTPPRYRSKIQDAARRHPGRGSFGDLGPGELALAEWQALGLELPDLQALRAYRLARLRAQLAARDYAGIVVGDPANIRYATDAANMQVWCLHNPARYAFVATAGPVILFDFHGCAHLAAPLALVDEVRPARAWYFFNSGGRVAEHAGLWAAELADLVQAHAGGNRRLAIDKADPGGGRSTRGPRARAAGRPGGHGAGARDQVGGRDPGDALRARDLRGGDGRDAAAAAPGDQRAGALGPSPRREHQARRRMDRDPPLELRPPHQPLVPGVQQPRRSRRAIWSPSTPT